MSKQISSETAGHSDWDDFFSHTKMSTRFCFDSITQNNDILFTFFGDIQSNCYYISDSMRDTFGFESNIVYDLIEAWKSRIHGEVWLKKYEQDIKSIFTDGRTVHDLRYVVEDRCGRTMWIRCYGVVQWNEAHTIPLYFSGRADKQDDHFIVDSSSNFLSGDTLGFHVAEELSADDPVSIIGFCINNVGYLNKLYGRQVTDRLLGRMSRRMMDELSSKVTFYRLRGIRAAAVTNSSDPEELEALIRSIRFIIEDEYQALSDYSEGCDHLCSFTLTRLPSPDLRLSSLRDDLVYLLRMARKTPNLFYLESSRQNLMKVQYYEGMEAALSRDVLHGMENFRAVVQPIVSEESSQVIGGETLLRWTYQGTDISPGIFVPVLEENGLIHLAGRWIFEQAVQACSRILHQNPDFYLTVNLSMHQLNDTEFLNIVPAVLEQYGLPGNHIVIELTESCMDQEPEKLQNLIRKFQSLGIRFALDDFGTGYSSLRVLMQYPTSIIKLDRSLLIEMSKSRKKTEFINSIVYACHQFGKKVCMEGVETLDQIELVRGANCDMIQGFYYYRPMELCDVYEMYEHQSNQSEQKGMFS